MKGQLLKVTNSLILLALNFPGLHLIFRKTPADCGDKVGNCSLFRKQNKRALRKVSGRGSNSSRKQLASNSNQGLSNKQTLPTLTVFFLTDAWFMVFL